MARGEEISNESDRKLIGYRRNNIGFVFQTPALFPHLSAADNIAYGLSHLPPHQRRQRRGRVRSRENPHKQHRDRPAHRPCGAAGHDLLESVSLAHSRIVPGETLAAECSASQCRENLCLKCLRIWCCSAPCAPSRSHARTAARRVRTF